MRHGSNMVNPLKIVFNVSRFKLALNLIPVFGRFDTRLKFLKFGLGNLQFKTHALM